MTGNARYMVSGEGRKPRLVAPPKSCDTHSHIYGPPDENIRNAILADNAAVLYDFGD